MSIEVVGLVAEMLVYVILTQAGVPGEERALFSATPPTFSMGSTLQELIAMQRCSKSDVKHEVSDKESLVKRPFVKARALNQIRRKTATA